MPSLDTRRLRRKKLQAVYSDNSKCAFCSLAIALCVNVYITYIVTISCYTVIVWRLSQNTCVVLILKMFRDKETTQLEEYVKMPPKPVAIYVWKCIFSKIYSYLFWKSRQTWQLHWLICRLTFNALQVSKVPWCHSYLYSLATSCHVHQMPVT